MEQFWINMLLTIIVYAILIMVMRWKASMRKPKSHNDDNDGGIPHDSSWEPDLDLPPGVVLPTGPHVVDKKPEEELV